MSENSKSQESIEHAVQKRLRADLISCFREKIEVLDSLAWKPYGLCIGVSDEHMTEVFTALRDQEQFLFNMLIDITAVDWLDKREPRFDVVYQLLGLTNNARLTVKIGVAEQKPELSSLRLLWPAANFLEREVWDMYGINFSDHGDLRRILMYDEFEGHPLRKDYPIRAKQPRVKLRIPEMRNTSADMKRDQLVAMPTKK